MLCQIRTEYAIRKGYYGQVRRRAWSCSDALAAARAGGQRLAGKGAQTVEKIYFSARKRRRPVILQQAGPQFSVSLQSHDSVRIVSSNAIYRFATNDVPVEVDGSALPGRAESDRKKVSPGCLRSSRSKSLLQQ